MRTKIDEGEKIMSKIEKIIYKCDVCEKEFENPKDVVMTSIPCYGGERDRKSTRLNSSHTP